MQKYLRLTRLQHLHPPDAILSRLAVCLANSASPEAFLSAFRHKEPSTTVFASFLAPRKFPGTQNAPSAGCCGPRSTVSVQLAQSWCLHVLEPEDPSSRSRSGSRTSPAMLLLKPGTRFQLSRAGVTLFCHIQLEPLLSLKRVRRILRIGSGGHTLTVWLHFFRIHIYTNTRFNWSYILFLSPHFVLNEISILSARFRLLLRKRSSKLIAFLCCWRM